MNISNLHDVESLINGGIEESEKLEYKSQLSSNGSIAREICGITNTSGGTIIYGLNCSDRKPTDINWLTDEGVDERIQNIISSSITPNLIGVRVCSVENPNNTSKAIFIVNIPKSNNGPHVLDGRFYIRSGSQTRPMNDREVKNLLYGQGRKEALRQELLANIDLAKRSIDSIDALYAKSPEVRAPISMIPFYTDAWIGTITSGAIFTLPENTLSQWMYSYRCIHEINALFNWLNTRDTMTIHTTADVTSFHTATYVPSILEGKLSRLYGVLIKLDEEWA